MGDAPATVKLDGLQSRAGHFFKDRSLLTRALTHPTAALEAGWTAEASYERLEFLGDALLNAWVAELLFEKFPHEDEGTLTKLRSHWVSGAVLAGFARDLGLPACLLLGEGGRRDGVAEQDRVQASAFEAFLAALYLDAGVRKGQAFVRKLWVSGVTRRGLDVLKEDAKTALQELRQAEGKPLPAYACQEVPEGFVASVSLDGEVVATGEGPSKKSAEQSAARAALQEIETRRTAQPSTRRS